MTYDGNTYRYVVTARWAYFLELLGIPYRYDEQKRMFTLPSLDLRLVHWCRGVRLPRGPDATREGGCIVVADNVEKTERQMVAVDANDEIVYVELGVDEHAFRTAQKQARRAFKRN